MLVAGVLLTGCAMSKETHLPDGRLGHSISCDGSAVGMNVCFEKAGELCKGRGYKSREKVRSSRSAPRRSTNTAAPPSSAV